jgi:hypothetical protein
MCVIDHALPAWLALSSQAIDRAAKRNAARRKAAAGSGGGRGIPANSARSATRSANFTAT